MLLQINTLLNFKDDKQECPCPEYIREQLLDFHEDLMRHCGTVHAQQNFHIYEHVHHNARTVHSFLLSVRYRVERGEGDRWRQRLHHPGSTDIFGGEGGLPQKKDGKPAEREGGQEAQ